MHLLKKKKKKRKEEAEEKKYFKGLLNPRKKLQVFLK